MGGKTTGVGQYLQEIVKQLAALETIAKEGDQEKNLDHIMPQLKTSSS